MTKTNTLSVSYVKLGRKMNKESGHSKTVYLVYQDMDVDNGNGLSVVAAYTDEAQAEAAVTWLEGEENTTN